MLKQILTDYFQSFFLEDDKTPVAWCSSVGPAEILKAFGYKVYYPENHGAMLGATRTSNNFISQAHALGYSPEICSYLSSDIGAYLKKETPLTKAYNIPHPPPPDILVYGTNQCREMQDWFSFYAKEFKVPMIGIFYPCKIDKIEKAHIDYIENQFKEFIETLENLIKKKLDTAKLEEVVDNSGKAARGWKKFLEKAQQKPSPITFFDGCIEMAPAVVLRGEQSAIDYYHYLNQKIDNIPVKNEQIRLYWEGMPVWGRLRFFSNLLKRLDANAIASTYCDSWTFDMFSAKDPLRTLAQGYTEIFINRSENIKEKILAEKIEQYACDGVIYHDAKTCPYNSNNRFGLPQRLKTPHLVIDGDLSDLRCFSDEQVTTSLEAFIEQLKENQ